MPRRTTKSRGKVNNISVDPNIACTGDICKYHRCRDVNNRNPRGKEKCVGFHIWDGNEWLVAKPIIKDGPLIKTVAIMNSGNTMEILSYEEYANRYYGSNIHQMISDQDSKPVMFHTENKDIMSKLI